MSSVVGPDQNDKRDCKDDVTGKKRKLGIDSDSDSSNGAHTAESDSTKTKTDVFKHFKLINVLREDDRHKFICLHGSLPADERSENHQGSQDANDAVVLLERKPFDARTVEECLHLTSANETLQNDIYRTFDVFSMDRRADMKATVICPATEKHISKYSEHERYIVHETPDLYKTVTLPCIEASKFSMQWVYNILDKKTETDRIVVEDLDPGTGFIMVPDMKWDRQKMESLYLIAIVQNRNLKSIRDLTGDHLPLLKNVLLKGLATISEVFGVSSDKLRIYFHYQPSYYHLHVHFTHIKFDAPGSDIMRAHLLNDVIDNLSIDSDIYRKKTLSYVVRDGDNLYKCYKDRGHFD